MASCPVGGCEVLPGWGWKLIEWSKIETIMYCSRTLILLGDRKYTPRPASSLLSRHYPAVNHVPKSFAPRSAKSYLKCQGFAKDMERDNSDIIKTKNSLRGFQPQLASTPSAEFGLSSVSVHLQSPSVAKRGWAGPQNLYRIPVKSWGRNINSPMTEITTLFQNPIEPKTYTMINKQGK